MNGAGLGTSGNERQRASPALRLGANFKCRKPDITTVIANNSETVDRDDDTEEYFSIRNRIKAEYPSRLVVSTLGDAHRNYCDSL